MSKDHFITIAGRPSDDNLHWWCECGEQGFSRAVLGYECIATKADAHIRQMDWERMSKS